MGKNTSSERQDSKRRLIIGITGATGAIYGIRLLQVLRTVPEVETHLIISKAAEQVIPLETEWTLRQVREMADVTYNVKDIAEIGRAHV